MADHCHHHHWSHTSEVRDGTSWAQDNPEPTSYGAQDYNAHRHCIPKGDVKVFAEQFARAMSGMVSRYRRATDPDSQQLCREVRATAIRFAKQIAAQAGAIASCSPSRVNRHACSDTAGHEHQQRPCPNRDKAKMTDQPRVEVIEKEDDRPRVEVIEKMSDRHRVKVVKTKQRAVGLQASQVLTDLVTRQGDEDGEELVRGKPP